jgi:DNA-binding winged helix-turn-helix (wHTH) protein/Tol biopolymer transport system component
MSESSQTVARPPERRSYLFGPFRLDASEGVLYQDEQPVPLSAKAFETLRLLVENHGHVVARDALMNQVWPNAFVEEHNLTVTVSLLRKILGEAWNGSECIETVPKRGYRFVAIVKEIVSETAGQARGRLGRVAMPAAELTPINARSIVSENSPVVAVTVTASQRRSKLKWGVAGVAVLVLAGIVAWVLRLALPLPKVIGSVQVTRDQLPKQNFLSDGTRLYLTEWVGGNSVLGQVSTEGGETSQIRTQFPNAIVLDIAPDHSGLLVSRQVTITETESPLWFLPLPSGSPRRMGDLNAHDARWSPDGQQIVYANGSSLYLAESDGSHSRKLATVAGAPFHPVFSPDGRHLRFTVYDSKTLSSSLWEVAVGGTTVHPLLEGWNKPPHECCGIWTPDGRYFVFQSVHQNVSSIWIRVEKFSGFRTFTPEPVQLTTGPLSFSNPVLSRDGKKLFVIGQQTRGELVRYDARSREFVPYLAGISASWVDFSRDGQWVTYITFPDGALWRSRVEGNDRLRLSYPPLEANQPRWSPDGTRIAFMARRPGKPWKIFIVSASGGNSQELVPEERIEADPTWSPDGNSLCFGRIPYEEFGASGQVAIQILNLRDSQISTVPGSEELFSPRWSPDGRYLAAMPSDSSKLMLFDFTTRKWLELAKGNFGFPNWSHDGKYIYFEDFFHGEIRRVHIPSQRFQRVAQIRELRRPNEDAGWWSAPAYDGSPLVMRDMGIQEIYALELQLR